MRDQRFTFLCTNMERLNLDRLADAYHRSKGDVIRMLLREAILALSVQVETKSDSKKGIIHDQSIIEST